MYSSNIEVDYFSFLPTWYCLVYIFLVSWFSKYCTVAPTGYVILFGWWLVVDIIYHIRLHIPAVAMIFYSLTLNLAVQCIVECRGQTFLALIKLHSSVIPSLNVRLNSNCTLFFSFSFIQTLSPCWALSQQQNLHNSSSVRFILTPFQLVVEVSFYIQFILSVWLTPSAIMLCVMKWSPSAHHQHRVQGGRILMRVQNISESFYYLFHFSSHASTFYFN